MKKLVLFIVSCPILLPAFPVSGQEADLSVIEEIEYAKPGGYSLKLDLYLPAKSSSPSPVVVFVHGGGWKGGSRKSGQKRAAWLTEHGFAVASIDYRLTDVAQWPAQIEDCYEAVRWVRRNAGNYHLAPDRIAAWGTSAGGHLVALMGTRPCPEHEETSSRVQAVCDWFGPSDLLTMPPNNVGNGRTADDVANSNGAKLLGATVRDVPDKARDASGLNNVSTDDPPFLIVHGEKDPGVPLEQSRKLHADLIAAGVPSQLVIVPEAGHGGPLFATPTVKQTVLQFFEQTLKPNWPQGAGPFGNFTNPTDPASLPKSWSVVRNENIRWKKTLPETGQSTVVVWGNRLFFTTLQPVEADSSLGRNIEAWCCDANSGEVLWKRDIPGDHPLRLSGCFSDSSGPPPVVDGQRVCFFNASGRIACFDFAGEKLWEREVMPVGRTQPFLIGNSVAFIKQSYMPDEQGHFTHEHKNAPLEQWTQLQTLDMATGQDVWTSRCGANMGCVPVPGTLSDGRRVIVVGRGGGHSPPEKPEGVSMIDATSGETLWTVPLPGFMSTMTLNISRDKALVFHRDEHLWIDTDTGKIVRRASILEDIPVREHRQTGWKTTRKNFPAGKKSREIIQQSNILVGEYHYFRSYTQPWLGRVHTQTGAVEYLQLPVQLSREKESSEDRLLWTAEDVPRNDAPQSSKQKTQKPLPITQWAFAPNSMKNSRGFVVMGDARSKGNGWGHHAGAVPTASGNLLFLPVMNGTVYVLKADAPVLDENAIVSINDLGPVGESWTRASLSLTGRRIYAHTIRELICIEQ